MHVLKIGDENNDNGVLSNLTLAQQKNGRGKSAVDFEAFLFLLFGFAA